MGIGGAKTTAPPADALTKWAPTADSTSLPQNSRFARASAKVIPDWADEFRFTHYSE